MTVTVTPTEEVADVDGMPTRKWEAITSEGVRFRMFVACVTCDPEDIPTLEGMGLVQKNFDISPLPMVYAHDEPGKGMGDGD